MRSSLLHVIALPLILLSVLGQQATAKSVTAASTEKPSDPVVWLRGVVRDAAGTPVGGAAVMALGTYFGSVRMYEIGAQTTTAPDGSYELKGAPALPGFSATVIASAPGHPPAWAWPTFTQVDPYESGKKITAEPPPIQDFVLASDSGSLDVKVFRQGKPAPGVTVAAYLQNANLRDVWAQGGGNSAITDVAYPKATTDTTGTARFTQLLPGTYRVAAAEDAQAARDRLYGFPEPSGEWNESTGVPVQVGHTTIHTMNIWEQNNKVVAKVQTPAGTPVAQSSAISYGPVDSITWSTTPQFDRQGYADLRVAHPGLWRVDVMSRDTPIKWYPIEEPFFRATAIVATSPNLPTVEPTPVTQTWVAAASVRIRVQDERGKPVRVGVRVGNAWESNGGQGTTDERGEVVLSGLKGGTKLFADLTSSSQMCVEKVDLGKFLLHPTGSNPDPPDINFHKVSSPEELWNRRRELRAQSAVMERTFRVQSDRETTLTLPVVPMRYIYGTLKAPPTVSGESWDVSVDYPWRRRGVDGLTLSGGRYILGPFPPGEVVLRVEGDPGTVYHPHVRITGKKRGAIEFNIDLSRFLNTVEYLPVERNNEPGTATLGMGGISIHAAGAHRLTGSVLFEDGTPALAAKVFYFPAHSAAPSLLAFADATGTLQPRGLWRTDGLDNQVSGPERTTVVALLPGTAGATIQTVLGPLGEPLRMMLPHSRSVSGRVTVGGSALSRQNGIIRVLASYKGPDFLRPYLNVETTADADGNFTLSGLSEGEYIVQSSLDNIWTSQPLALNAQAGPVSLHLDIPLPGAGLHLNIHDPNGKPCARVIVTLERSGPMSSLWPKIWTTDGAGSVAIPTLETGSHMLYVAGKQLPVKVEVPAMPSAPVELTFILQQKTIEPTRADDPYDPSVP